MKVNTLRSHRVMSILLCLAAAIGRFACVPLYAYDIPDEYAEREKLTPDQRKDLSAVLDLYEEADDLAKAADHYAKQGDVQATAGKYARALELHRKALMGYERVLGPEHVDTLSVRHNLGLRLIQARKLDEAVAEFRAILAIKQRAWGMTNSGTWYTWNRLAHTLELQGKHDEALAEYRAVLPRMLRGYGPENQNTLETQMHLANVLQAQGKLAEAEQEHRAVVKVSERVMGPWRGAPIQNYYHLALCLESQGKLVEALEFMQKAEHGWEGLSYRENTDYRAAKAARERIEATLKK